MGRPEYLGRSTDLGAMALKIGCTHMIAKKQWNHKLLLLGALLMTAAGVIGLIQNWSAQRPSLPTYLLLFGVASLWVGSVFGNRGSKRGCCQTLDNGLQGAAPSLWRRMLWGLCFGMLAVAGIIGLTDHWGERGQAVPTYLLLIGFALLMVERGMGTASSQTESEPES